MGAAGFDSLQAALELEVAGVERNQADAIVRVIVAASRASRKDAAATADFAKFESRREARFSAPGTGFPVLGAGIDAAVNRMILGQALVYGLLFAALKLF